MAPDQTNSATALPGRGSWAQRIALRFFCVYLGLYFFPSPLDMFSWFPGVQWLLGANDKLWLWIVPWVGRHVLRLQEIPTYPEGTGSGDTAYSYVQLFCAVLLALLATSVWLLIDARRAEADKARHEHTLYRLVRIYLRYNLGIIMLNYGMVKVFKSQFPFPSFERLSQPYGDSSPMGLLWTFMGFSTAYNVFTGAAEVLGGFLLLFRRTTTLGALVLIGVLSNVVVLNLCYDVPVKQFSMHLLGVAIFLLLPDLQRVMNLLILNRPTAPVVFRVPFAARWQERARVILKLAFIVLATLATSKNAWDSQKRRSNNTPPTAGLYGFYEVESYTHSGVAAPLLVTDGAIWRTVKVSYTQGKTIFSIRQMDDKRQIFFTQDDRTKQTIALTGVRDSSQEATLGYAQPDAAHLVLTGTFDKEPLIVRLRRVNDPQFLLITRGFHWVNEFPLNR